MIGKPTVHQRQRLIKLLTAMAAGKRDWATTIHDKLRE
jgi:hypothetical protein